jgi:hypothetical protein
MRSAGFQNALKTAKWQLNVLIDNSILEAPLLV